MTNTPFSDAPSGHGSEMSEGLPASTWAAGTWWSDAPVWVGHKGSSGSAAYVAAASRPLCVAGAPRRGAEIGSIGLRSGPAGEVAELLHEGVAALKSAGFELAYAAVNEADLATFSAEGFVPRSTGSVRNLILGSSAETGTLGPVRKIAGAARRLRPKLVDVPLDAVRLDMFAELFTHEEAGLRLHKNKDYLTKRYRGDEYRALVYRSNAGQAVQSLVILRNFVSEAGRRVVHLEDCWTRRGNRRDLAKILGEVALMSFGEGQQVLRSFSLVGSPLESAFAGPWRKKTEVHIVLLPLTEDTASALDTQVRLHLVGGDVQLYAP